MLYRWPFAVAAFLAIAATSLTPPVWAAAALKICLEEDSPPYSYKFGKKQGGFDRDLAAALAKRLERDLEIQWYETEYDDETIPKLEANALLSSGLCDLVGAYPLMRSALGDAPQGSFKLPEHDGQKRDERFKTVKLGIVTNSAPYNRMVFAAIVGPAIAGQVRSLDDFKGVRVMSEVATVPAVLLLRHDNGALVDNTSHVSPLKNLFKLMDAGEADATLIGLHRFERYRFRNPDTKLRFGGYVSPLGVNLGYAALTTSQDLLADVNRALSEMKADGTLDAIAARNNMTLMAPKKPDVMEKFTLP